MLTRDYSDPQFNPRVDRPRTIRPKQLLEPGLSDRAARRALDAILHPSPPPFTVEDITSLDLTDE